MSELAAATAAAAAAATCCLVCIRVAVGCRRVRDRVGVSNLRYLVSPHGVGLMVGETASGRTTSGYQEDRRFLPEDSREDKGGKEVSEPVRSTVLWRWEVGTTLRSVT